VPSDFYVQCIAFESIQEMPVCKMLEKPVQDHSKQKALPLIAIRSLHLAAGHCSIYTCSIHL